MPAPVYSTSVLQVQGLTSSATYTVPAGQLLVVRDIEHYWNGPSASNHTFWEGDAGQTWFFIENTITSGQRWGTWTGRVVLREQLVVRTDADPVDVTISGYLLTLP